MVDEVFEQIQKSIRKEKRFSYPGFGTFTLQKRAARVGRNLQTGDTIPIGPSKTVSFKPSANFKSSL
ncbi:MAG: HU family DNA-binding protein [Myxococcota bacterium]